MTTETKGTATTTATVEEQTSLESLFSSINVEVTEAALSAVDYGYVTSEENKEDVLKNDFARVGAALSAIFANTEADNIKTYNKELTRSVIDRIDEVIEKQINDIIKDAKFREIEQQWLSIQDLYDSIPRDKNVEVSIFDASKDELLDDFETNAVDVSSSEFFKKVYVDEYDQYGGEPYGSIVGLYEFENTEDDINWLSVMGKISATSHSPFISAASPKFFGCENMSDLKEIKNLGAMMSHHRYGKWNTFRKTSQAAYIGLTLPRYLARSPYDPINNPAGKLLPSFEEKIGNPESSEDFAWGNASILMAKNMMRSFEKTGWCQSIRGVHSGGTVENLASYSYNTRGMEETKIPVEFMIPDYRELDFANAGFMPFVYKKESNEGCFFSANSIKLKEEFQDPKDSENSQLIANISYTMSISRIAHYVKVMVRDKIGGNDDEMTLSAFLNKWIFQYVTTVPDPSPLTASYHPFKAASISVNKVEGMSGWYNSSISILPHIQFEGMDVELTVDARLG
ncbi:type VI secretion system contractile sheath large subunit [Francisellaceae bacterium]|nr:type VI secretion system contractile sheath large subunit [Francisellaceae bacterium]